MAPRLTYAPVPNWGGLPDGLTFNGDATAVAVDSEDQVYVFNRGPIPVVVFASDGTFIRGFGEDEFDSPHGISIDSRDRLVLVDRNHFVQQRTRENKVVLTLGSRGVPTTKFAGHPFNKPTDAAVHPRSGDIFVTDGYGNAHVHHFEEAGQLIRTWGGLGSRTGELNNPHGIDFLDDERLIVCDRESHRLQIFSTEGNPLGQWHAHRPMAVRKARANGLIYVAEGGPLTKEGARLANLGRRVVIYTTHGDVVGQFGSEVSGYGADQFISPHSVAIDSYGDVYVAEVNRSLAKAFGEEPPMGQERPSLRKWRLLRDEEKPEPVQVQ
jgi:DNA-binding beta-propeller fold protein YncE